MSAEDPYVRSSSMVPLEGLFVRLNHAVYPAGVRSSQRDVSGTEMFVSCVDICRSLQNTSGVATLERKCRTACAKFTTLSRRSPTHVSAHADRGECVVWKPISSEDAGAQPLLDRKPVWCVHTSELCSFVRWVLTASRKTRVRIAELASKFGISVLSTNLASARVCKQTAVQEVLERFVPYEMRCEYRVGDYRIDMYMERLHLAIEVDEGGHGSYDSEDEKVREDTLRKHGMRLWRFNPDAVGCPDRSTDPRGFEAYVVREFTRFICSFLSP